MKSLALLLLTVSSACARHAPFIVGGQDVNPPGKWPWQASLEVDSGGDGSYSHTCGASLVATQYLTCAAHCLTMTPGSYQILLGAHDRISQQQGGPTIYAMSSYVRHPDWVRDGSLGFPNDAAAIRLDVPANVSSQFIGTVTMAARDDGQNPDYTNAHACYITGWGRLWGFGPLPDVLQEAQIRVMTQAECRDTWGERIQRYHICLTDVDNTRQGRGACSGDSGGPLVCRMTQTDPWTMAGITSWGMVGCNTAAPSVYVRVSYFREWFDQQVGPIQ